MSRYLFRLAAFVDSMLGGARAGHDEVPFNAFSGTMIFGCRRSDR